MRVEFFIKQRCRPKGTLRFFADGRRIQAFQRGHASARFSAATEQISVVTNVTGRTASKDLRAGTYCCVWKDFIKLLLRRNLLVSGCSLKGFLRGDSTTTHYRLKQGSFGLPHDLRVFRRRTYRDSVPVC